MANASPAHRRDAPQVSEHVIIERATAMDCASFQTEDKDELQKQNYLGAWNVGWDDAGFIPRGSIHQADRLQLWVAARTLISNLLTMTLSEFSNASTQLNRRQRIVGAHDNA